MMEKVKMFLAVLFVFLGVSTADSENLLIPVVLMSIGILMFREFASTEKKETRRK